MKLDFRRPLHPPTEKPESAWCIPFEYGANEKGTCISIPKAKQIAAELRAEVAEAEMRELRRAFEDERRRSQTFAEQASTAQSDALLARAEVGELTRKARRNARRR